MNVLAYALGIIFIFIGKSTFISVSGLPENFSFISNFSFWLPLLVFVLIGGLLSGLYPAFVLSSFKPSSILKGDFSHSLKGAFLRKGLVVFQFAVTIILLIQTFTVNEQIDFLRGMERGVNVDQNIVIEAPIKNANQNYSVFKQTLLANANVKAVSLSHSVPGQSVAQLSTTADIVITGTTPDKYHNFYLTFIDKDYISLLGVDLLSGTNFSDAANASRRQVIVNEEALKRWNITKPEDAVGKKLAFWGGDWEIKGVAKNYHQQSPKQPLLPMIHIYSNTFRSLATVQFTGGTPSDNLALVKAKYTSIYPGAPFSYFFMDQEYDKQFKAEDRFKDVFMVLTCFSILIACLGLLGLASFSVAKRKKEIGIRKVVGASTATLLLLLSKDFLKTMLISVVISVPLTYLLVQNWLTNFAYKIDIHIWLFVIPILLVFGLVLVSISFKTVKTALANPIKSLRTE